jgi:lipid A disaccharide synthetase
MINLRNNKLKVSVISYIFSVLIKILFIPLFNILLKTNLFKKLFFEKLTINSDLYINFKKIDRNYVQKPEKFSVKNIQYQLELSSETLEIYKDFQLVVNNLL